MVSAVGQAEFFLRVKQTLGAPRRAPPPAGTGATNHQSRVCVRSTIKLLSLDYTACACVCAIIVICYSSNRKRSEPVCVNVCRFFISG